MNTASLSKPTVYIVDDDASVRESLSWWLEGEDLPTRTFNSADSMLAAYRPNWRGCIVSDVRMPGTDGLQLQERLIERGSHLPFIIITGHADVAMAVRAMKAGAFDFIEKPFANEALLEVIQSALAAGAGGRVTSSVGSGEP